MPITVPMPAPLLRSAAGLVSAGCTAARGGVFAAAAAGAPAAWSAAPVPGGGDAGTAPAAGSPVIGPPRGGRGSLSVRFTASVVARLPDAAPALAFTSGFGAIV